MHCICIVRRARKKLKISVAKRHTIVYYCYMDFFSWNNEKNEQLKNERGICFEDIVLRIHSDHILAIVNHPNQKKYPSQKILIINVDGYAYMVPFIEQQEGFFLKTIIPSRKYTKQYLAGD